MKIKPGLLWSLFIVLAMPALGVAQEIYKWKDEKGQWHFSQTPSTPNGAEKLNLPTPESAQLRRREEWQKFYAAFQDDRYKPAGAIPRTRALERLISLSVGFCHIYEGTAALAYGAGQRDRASELTDSARFCASEAEIVFSEMYQKSQAELSREKPSALTKLRALGTSWLSIIRRIPRFEASGALRNSQETEKEELGRRRSELDMELM